MKALPSFPLRHAISSLHRPGNQTRLIVLSVGLGVFFIVATYSLQKNLLRELDFQNRAGMASMYLIDVQTDQKQQVEKLIRENLKEKPELVPTVRARIYAINGKVIDLEDPEQKKDRGRLGFEYTLTYRFHLDRTERIVAGKFWDRTPSETPEVSLDADLRGMMGLDLGGTITFDIAGRKIKARVTSIREIDWKNSRTAFYVIFRPGVLEKAPQMYVAPLSANTSESERSRFQRKVADAFPNITVIDVTDILGHFKRIISNITLGVSFIGAFVLFSGALILVGSIAMTKFQRIYEAAVLKTLGAGKELVLKILIVEYGILGIVAGILGSTAGMLLSYSLSKWVFEIPWNYSPAFQAISVILSCAIVLLVGSLASMDVLVRKPLAVLRTN